MQLTYQQQLRNESDPAVIANLQRKGWVETVPPSYDAATQNAPEWVNGEWIVRDKTTEGMIVSMRSFREACGRDLVIKINAFVASIPDAYERFSVQNDLEYALTVARDHPKVAQVAAAIGKTESEIDEVFALAQYLDSK